MLLLLLSKLLNCDRFLVRIRDDIVFQLLLCYKLTIHFDGFAECEN